MEHSKDTSHNTKKKGADSDKLVVNVDQMLDELRKQIIAIYKREIGEREESGKKTITLLNVSKLVGYLITFKPFRKSKSDATKA